MSSRNRRGLYTPGASILWLRFVNSEPNEFALTHPIATKDGEGLLPKNSP